MVYNRRFLGRMDRFDSTSQNILDASVAADVLDLGEDGPLVVVGVLWVLVGVISHLVQPVHDSLFIFDLLGRDVVFGLVHDPIRRHGSESGQQPRASLLNGLIYAGEEQLAHLLINYLHVHYRTLFSNG